MAYTVIRTDLLSGAKQPADLVSFRFYNGDDEMTEVENGVIVKLEGLEDGEREIMRAVAASVGDSLNECAIAAGVELMYDERKRNLAEFINEAGTPTRGYIPRSRNMFSVTAEGFVDGAVPSIGDEVGIGAGGKIDAAGSGLGTCVDIDISSRFTFYTIMIATTEV